MDFKFVKPDEGPLRLYALFGDGTVKIKLLLRDIYMYNLMWITIWVLSSSILSMLQVLTPWLHIYLASVNLEVIQHTTQDGTSRPCSITPAHSLSGGGCSWCMLTARITDKTSCWTSNSSTVESHCGCVECSVHKYSTPNTSVITTWILSSRSIQYTNIR